MFINFEKSFDLILTMANYIYKTIIKKTNFGDFYLTLHILEYLISSEW